MTVTAETGVKRRSSRRLRFFRCFTAVDDEESCSPAFDDVAVIDTYGGGVGRLSDLRSSSPVTSRQKKRFWIFSGVVESVRSVSLPAKKHRRRKSRFGQLSESNNKFCRKQNNLDITNNSNKDMETDTVEGSSSSSSISTNSITSVSSEASTSSTSSFSSSRSFNACESKHKTIIDSALCLLVVSLLAVIVWGKVCAIVCTSTWLCIMFGRPSSLEEHPQMRSASDDAVESEAYKKKIVLGGFLHRRNCKQHI